jgi:hypothetical protein
MCARVVTMLIVRMIVMRMIVVRMMFAVSMRGVRSILLDEFGFRSDVVKGV